MKQLFVLLFALVPLAAPAWGWQDPVKEPVVETQPPAASKPMETQVEIITYTEADTVAITKYQDEVAKFIASGDVGLNGKTVFLTGAKAPVLALTERTAAQLTVTNQANDWVEVHDVAKPFPPQVLKAFKPGIYLIHGTPGQEFWVSIRSADAPEWVFVKIPTGGTIPDLPGDFADLVKVVTDKASKLTERATILPLAIAYENACAVMAAPSVTLDQAFKLVSKAREDVLGAKPHNDNTWNDYIVAVEAELVKLKFTSKEQYRLAVLAIVDTLKKAAGVAPAMRSNAIQRSQPGVIYQSVPGVQMVPGNCPGGMCPAPGVQWTDRPLWTVPYSQNPDPGGFMRRIR